jgi:thioredoxin 1
MDETLWVACLCAAWCRLCDEYAAVFDTALPAGVRKAWVDIEDHADVLDEVDIDNFPTLLIARGDALLFFGTVEPQPSTLARLVQRAQRGELPPAPDPHRIASRLRAALGA